MQRIKEDVMRWTRIVIVAGTMAIFGTGQVWGGPIDETVTASADGTVRVSNVAGSVRVVGAQGTNVRVTGTVDEKVEDVRIEESAGNVRIEVVLPRNLRGNGGDADLVVEVPKGADVEVETVSASIEVEGVAGSLELESVSGGVGVRGPCAAVEASTVSGSIDVVGGMERVEVESVSGAIRLEEVGGRVGAETTSGSIEVDAEGLSKVECTSVSGGIRFDGSPADDAEVILENFSGSIDVVLGANPDADIEIETFSGTIDSEFNGRVHRPEFGPGASLAETLGKGSAQISISTFSGDVELKKKAAAGKGK
jgi:DUF4097 and DUF4098 domain-containing protein YvlB